MIIVNKQGSTVDILNFDDLYIIEKWIKKMILEIKSIKGQLCPCKYDILQLKWHELIYWFNNISLKIIQEKILYYDDFVNSITSVISSYEKLQEPIIISNVIYPIFKEIHQVTTTEFINEIKKKIELLNDKKIEVNDFINFFGEQLYSSMINSIFEISEITLRCSNTECDYNVPLGSESFRFLINDIYNINSFSVFKLKKFIEMLNVNSENVDFIADFKYFNDDFVNPNVIRLLDLAVEKFKSLRITNISLMLRNKFKGKYDKYIA